MNNSVNVFNNNNFANGCVGELYRLFTASGKKSAFDCDIIKYNCAIANTVTETEIPDWMCEAGVADCFKTVILSSKVRLRKPDPAIYLLSCRCIGSEPQNCAYVGDNPVRDVEGALDAGFGCMVLFEDAGTADREGKTPSRQPTARIRSIPELMDLFPDLKEISE